MQDLIKGELDWHNKVNNNFHEVDSDKISSSNLVELVGYGVITGLEVLVQTTPNMTVKVNAGIVYMSDGTRIAFSGNDSIPISPADAENPRVDIIYINSDGTAGYIAGVPFTAPIAPNVPEDAFLLAKINVAVGATIITSEDIMDMRKMIDATDELEEKIADLTEEVNENKADNVQQFNNINTVIASKLDVLSSSAVAGTIYAYKNIGGSL